MSHTYTVKQVIEKDNVPIGTKIVYNKANQSTTAEMLLKYLALDMVSFDQQKLKLMDIIMSYMPAQANILQDLHDSGSLADVFSEAVSLLETGSKDLFDDLVRGINANDMMNTIINWVGNYDDRIIAITNGWRYAFENLTSQWYKVVGDVLLDCYDTQATYAHRWTAVKNIFTYINSVDPGKGCAIINALKTELGC